MKKRTAKALKIVGLATAAFAVVGAITAELWARHDLNARVEGLPDRDRGHDSKRPRLCTMGSPQIKAHFTAAELRLLEGLYRDTLDDDLIVEDLETKYYNRVRAIDAAVAASLRTGFPVGILLIKMRQESGLGFNRKAKTSSAQGNLQGIKATWLGMLAQEIPNDALYFKQYGDMIKNIKYTDEKGYEVADKKIERTLLDLRLNNPELEAHLFAKIFARRYPDAVRKAAPTSVAFRAFNEWRGEMWENMLMSLPAPLRLQIDGDFTRQHKMYLDHFLGPAGAKKFNNISTFYYLFGNVGDYFPAATKANTEIMKGKSPRAVSWTFARRIDRIQNDHALTAVAKGSLREFCFPSSPIGRRWNINVKLP